MPEIILPIFIGLLTIVVLLYIAVEDIRTMKVHKRLSYGLLGFYVALNLILIALYGTEARFVISEDITYYPYLNLVTGTILVTATSLIIFITKQKGMGWGDTVYLGLLGLICGYPKSITALYIAIFSALIYGIVVGIRKKKILGVRIPFIPFIVEGIVLGFLLGDGVPRAVSNLLSIALSWLQI